MKLQVRNSVFETNSSSVHAISIFKDDTYENYNGEYLEIEPGKFGWEKDTYNDVYSKLSYLYAAYLEFVDKEYVDEETIKEFEWFIPTVKELCEEHGLNIDFDDPKNHDGFFFVLC